jgi:hypothetical protein
MQEKYVTKKKNILVQIFQISLNIGLFFTLENENKL